MPGKTKTSDGAKRQYAAYAVEKHRELNKIRKIERHLKKHPTDKQSKDRVVPTSYRRN